MTDSEAGLTCSRIENPLWDSETSLWSCVPNISMLKECEDIISLSGGETEGYRRTSADIRNAGMVFRLIEITGRLDSETVCTAEGIEYDYAVCFNDAWIYIVSVRETDNNPAVNAGRRCLNGIRENTGEPLLTLEDGTTSVYEPCDTGWFERIDSSGIRWCHSPPDCGSSLVAIYVPESDSYVCSETEETASQFWEYAFQARGIQGDYQKARWIGGLGITYNKNLWRESMAIPGQDYEGELEAWAYINQASVEEQMRHVAEGTSHVHICYDHDCVKAGNLVGSTDRNVSSCQAFVWHTEEGLWFLMRIDESAPVCVRAFDKVASGEINGASSGYGSLSGDTGRTAPKDGIKRPVYYEYDVEFEEITLTQSSEGHAPVDNNTWVSAIDLRE